MPQRVYSGAIQGLVAWLAYGVVECFFLSILPWISRPHSIYAPLHSGFTALLFGFYAGIGLVVGVSTALILHVLSIRIASLQKVDTRAFCRAAATCSLGFVLVINLFRYSRLGLPHLLSLMFFLLLVASLCLAVYSTLWTRRLAFLTNAWTTSMTLIGICWIAESSPRESSIMATTVKSLTYVVMVAVLAFSIQKLFGVSHIRLIMTNVLSSAARSLAFVATSALLVFGFSASLKQQPYFPASLSGSSSPLDDDHPNVLLIVLDTVRADHMSAYGYKRNTTPNFKEFSEKATLYRRAIAPGDTTLSSHASIFTGLYVTSHRAHFFRGYPGGRPLTQDVHTLAEILADKGYRTLGLAANYPYLNSGFGLDQGFQYFDNRMPVPFLAATKEYCLRQRVRNLLGRFFPLHHSEQQFRTAENINNALFDLLEKTKTDGKRFFLFVNYMDAHWPYLPPPPFDARYPGKENGFTTHRYLDLQVQVIKGQLKLSARDLDHLVSQYDGAIAYLDFCLGQLLSRLKEIGLYENSLILITSDHGETLGEEGLFGHGFSVSQSQVHVPLIIKFPHSNEKVRVDQTVSLVDLIPTILDQLGMNVPQDYQGRSLLKTGQENSHLVISESFVNPAMSQWNPDFRRIQRAMFSGPFKFITSTSGKRELYNLSKDPNELVNLYKVGSSTHLEAKLKQWLEQVIVEESRVPPTVNKEIIDVLRSLGYVQ